MQRSGRGDHRRISREEFRDVEPETRDEISECLEISERRADTCEAADCDRADTCERTERASSSVTGCAAADPPSAASVSAACCPALSSVAICFSRFAASADSSFSTRCFQHLTRAESRMSEAGLARYCGGVGRTLSTAARSS